MSAAQPDPEAWRNDIKKTQLVASLKDSIDTYSKLVAVGGSDCASLLRLANARKELGLTYRRFGYDRESRYVRDHLGSAIDDFYKVTTQCPDDPEGWMGLGSTLSSLGEYARAIPPYEVLVEAWPLNATYAIAVAQLNEWAGNLEQAAVWYERVLTTYETTVPVRLAYADVLDRLGRHQEALEQRRVYRDNGEGGQSDIDPVRWRKLLELTGITELLRGLNKVPDATREAETRAIYEEAIRRVEVWSTDAVYGAEARALARQLQLGAAIRLKRIETGPRDH